MWILCVLIVWQIHTHTNISNILIFTNIYTGNSHNCHACTISATGREELEIKDVDSREDIQSLTYQEQYFYEN